MYALVWRASDDKVCIVSSGAFEVYVEANIDNYDVQLTNQGDGVGGYSDFYSGDFPATIVDTTQQPYRVQVFLQADGSPSAYNDTAIAQGEIHWDGTIEINIGTINITNQTVTNIYDESQPPPITVIDISTL